MRILVASGASGGHIFPALSLLDTLKDRQQGIDTLLVLPLRRAFQYKGLQGQIKYLPISTIKPRLTLENLIALFRFLKGSLESLFILLEFKPDIVVGFGSLNSIPLVFCAWLLRIKTLVHEQNVIPGRANRLLAKFTDRFAVSFPETKDYLNISQDKIALTGNPIRQGLKAIEKNKALEFFGFSDDKFTILVMGGSLGSQSINRAFLKAISGIQEDYKFQVIHITGEADYAALNSTYKDYKINIRLFSFLEEMQYAYSAADLAIARAGATTIAELIFFRLAAVLIPYPFAHKHQAANARVLEKRGCAAVMDGYDLDAQALKEILIDLMDDPQRLGAMRSGYDKITQGSANGLLAQEVLSLS